MNNQSMNANPNRSLVPLATERTAKHFPSTRLRTFFVGLVALLCLCLNTGAAFAQSGEQACLSWILPTTGTTASGQTVNLAPGDLQQINIYMNDVLQPIPVAGDETTACVLNIPYGANDFYVTAVHTNGLESTMSNVVVRAPANPVTPDAPTLIDVVLSLMRICDAGNWPNELDGFCGYYIAAK